MSLRTETEHLPISLPPPIDFDIKKLHYTVAGPRGLV